MAEGICFPDGVRTAPEKTGNFFGSTPMETYTTSQQMDSANTVDLLALCLRESAPDIEAQHWLAETHCQSPQEGSTAPGSANTPISKSAYQVPLTQLPPLTLVPRKPVVVEVPYVLHRETKKRKRFPLETHMCLDSHYARDTKLDPDRTKHLAKLAGISEEQVVVWFRNKKYRSRQRRTDKNQQ